MATKFTVDNFVAVIKKMNDRDRGKLRAADLIKLIVQLPNHSTEPSTGTEFIAKFETLVSQVALLDSHANKNAAEILNLQESNKALRSVNAKNETELLKLNQQVADLTTQAASTDQYLRVNNVEIVGLPEPGDGETEQEQTILMLNDLTSDDDPPVTSKTSIFVINSSWKDNNEQTSVVKLLCEEQLRNLVLPYTLINV